MILNSEASIKLEIQRLTWIHMNIFKCLSNVPHDERN